MFYRELGEDRCASGRLASENQLVVIEAYILTIFPDERDQGHGDLHYEEDHAKVVHAFDWACNCPLSKALIPIKRHVPSGVARAAFKHL